MATETFKERAQNLAFMLWIQSGMECRIFGNLTRFNLLKHSYDPLKFINPSAPGLLYNVLEVGVVAHVIYKGCKTLKTECCRRAPAAE